MKKNNIKICPKCESTDIKFMNQNGPNYVKCNTCSFTSLDFPEVSVKEVKKIQNKNK